MVGLHNIIFILLFVTHAKSGRNNYNFFPNLPVGEYQWYFKSMLPCIISSNSTEKLPFRNSFYMSKTSSNTTELRGSAWCDILFDDSLIFNLNFAIKDSIGGWKDNAYVYKAPKLCTKVKEFLGKTWPLLVNAFGINSTDCPVLPGTYVSRGFDLSSLHKHLRFPKVFFYGVYKVRIYITNENNKVYGCTIFIIDVKRPWEEE